MLCHPFAFRALYNAQNDNRCSIFYSVFSLESLNFQNLLLQFFFHFPNCMTSHLCLKYLKSITTYTVIHFFFSSMSLNALRGLYCFFIHTKHPLRVPCCGLLPSKASELSLCLRSSFHTGLLSPDQATCTL